MPTTKPSRFRDIAILGAMVAALGATGCAQRVMQPEVAATTARAERQCVADVCLHYANVPGGDPIAAE